MPDDVTALIEHEQNTNAGSAFESEITANRLFDFRWYSKRYNLKFLDEKEALQEFLKVGSKEGRNPNALFDSEFYKQAHNLSALDDLPPFFHYLRVGIDKSYWPHPLIDPTWVSNQLKNKGLSDGVMSALLHKCAALQIDPHPCFSVRFYLFHYPELARRRVHPIIHYLENGEQERRIPHPLFWPDWFRNNCDAEGQKGWLLLKYLHNPAFHEVEPSPFFNGSDYLNRHPDVAEVGLNPLYHYLRFGIEEFRNPNEYLDATWVQTTYKCEIKATKLDPLSFLVAHPTGFIYADSKNRPIQFTTKRDRLSALNSYRRHFPDVNVDRGRKRILFVSHNLKVQGAQTSLFELATGMRRKPHYDIHVMAPDSGAMRALYQSAGLPVHKYYLPVSGLADGAKYQELLINFEQFILEKRPDIVHGNTVQSYHALAIAARHRIPTVWNIRESEDPGSHLETLHPCARDLFKEALTSVSHFAFVSETTRDLWRRSFPEIRSSAILNGINYSRLTPSFRNVNRAAARSKYQVAETDIVILSIGTWTPRKGQKDVIQALQLIDRRLWPRIRLLIIGANESPFSQEVQTEINQCPAGLRDRIQSYPETTGLAERSGVLAAYAAADIFAFTSRIESYPRVVNEAMNSGLAIVATPCFGVVEQIEADVSGKFYEPGNVKELAAKLSDLITNAELRKSLGDAARYRARNRLFQYQDMIDMYENIYKNLWEEFGQC